MEEQFLKVKELANILRVSDSAIYYWVAKGAVPRYKILGTTRFKFSEVAEAMKSRGDETIGL